MREEIYGYNMRTFSGLGLCGSKCDGMKIYLQSVPSGAFAMDAHCWTTDQKTARVFHDPEAALQFCVDHGLKRVKILIENSKGSLEIFVPTSSIASALESWRHLQR